MNSKEDELLIVSLTRGQVKALYLSGTPIPIWDEEDGEKLIHDHEVACETLRSVLGETAT